MQFMQKLPSVAIRHFNVSFLMKVSTFFISFLFCSAQFFLAFAGNGQGMNEKKITLELHDESLLNALSKVEKLSGIRMAYVLEQVTKYDHISLSKETRTVSTTINLILAGTGLGCKEDGKTLLIFPYPPTVSILTAAETFVPEMDTTRTIAGR